MHNLFSSWDNQSFHFLPLLQIPTHTVCFHLRPFEQKPQLRWLFQLSRQFYLLLKIQNLRLLIKLLSEFPKQPSLFSQSLSSFYFFYHRIVLLYKRDMKIELSQSLSHLYSRTADGSNSAPAKIKGKLQYPHNSTWAENGSFVCLICKPDDTISYAYR